MRISVFGLGYVGTVTAACLARDGHAVVGVDVSQAKVDEINAGRAPIIEPDLPEVVAAAVGNGSLRATTSAAEAVEDSQLSLICVGTPSNDNGSLNLTYVKRVCENIGHALARLDRPHTVVVRSTVLPGTTRSELLPVLETAAGRTVGAKLGLGMNPEFLRESSAVADYYEPCFIVIGQFDEASGNAIEQLYANIDAPTIRVDMETAEMVKYVCNAFHALKVVFANEVGNLCKAHSIDGREVMDIFCRDERLNISKAYFKPGFAFGGSCLPKDLRSLMYAAKHRDVETPVLRTVLESNRHQVARGIEMVERTGKKRIGVFGLSFKAGTDDVRESPVVPLVETLVGRGYDVRIYDETLRPDRLVGSNKAFIESQLPHFATLMRSSPEEVVGEADVLVVTNGSKSCQQVSSLAQQHQTVIDLVGIERTNGSAKHGEYDGICW